MLDINLGPKWHHCFVDEGGPSQHESGLYINTHTHVELNWSKLGSIRKNKIIFITISSLPDSVIPVEVCLFT